MKNYIPKYQLIEESGYKVLESYLCFINGEFIELWKISFKSQNKAQCEAYIEKYKNTSKKSYKIPEIIF